MQPLPRAALLFFVFTSTALAACEGPAPTADATGGDAAAGCGSDAECSDGVFCNGEERCAPGASGADDRGCAPASTPSPCMATQVCEEEANRCRTRCEVEGDADGDGARASECGGLDCDDADPERFPGHAEVCDVAGHDEDCDAATYGFRDSDGDLAGDARCCNVADDGSSTCGADCDDMAPAVHPGSTEACNALDDDCDEAIDEGVLTALYVDGDGDGYGDSAMATTGCPGSIPDTVLVGGDCDDAVAGRNPGLAEVCDLLGDNDCDPATNPFDADGDGHDRANCGGDDCNDASATAYDGAPELCNAIDDDCSSCNVDTGLCTGATCATPTTPCGAAGSDTAEDADGDLHAPAGATCSGGLPADDCDDAHEVALPGGTELCDGLDNDCDGTLDDAPDVVPSCSPASAHGTGECVAASCHRVTCEAGRGDCDAVPADCETDLTSSAQQCGACGLSCGPEGACTAGRCARIVQVDVGTYHVCAVREDGALLCWGRSTQGQVGFPRPGPSAPYPDRTAPAVVPGVADVVEVATGGEFTCFRTRTGGVGCFGSNAAGQSAAPAIADAVQISAGSTHACARRAGGAITCWGSNGSGERGDGSITDAIDLSAGASHTCVVRSGGQVWCWGANGNQQLGAGGAGGATPVRAGTFTGAVEVAGGDRHTCARLGDGTMRCWGDNTNGQLGDGGSGASARPPNPVSGMTSAAEIDAGTQITCARLASGQAQCWGVNTRGEVSGSSNMIERTPFSILDGAGSTGIAAADGTACALRGTGQLRCWGFGLHFQNGSAPGGGRLARRVADPVAISAGPAHACALLSTGQVECWGRNGAGQLGDGTTTMRVSPVPVPGMGDAVEIATGASHSCARRRDGTVWCWGEGSSGQLGDGASTDRLAPVQVSGIADAIGIAAGGDHGCAVLRDASVWCWGENGAGELGDGTTTTRSAPVRVIGVDDAHQIAIAVDHACALRATGVVSCWGSNANGRLGAPGASGATPVDAELAVPAMHVTTGATYTCAVARDGRGYCWGTGAPWVLGIPSSGPPPPDQPRPTAVAGASTYAEIEGGVYLTCARTAAGPGQCWGASSYGACGNGGSGCSTPVAISDTGALRDVTAGEQFGCATRADGRAICWGRADEGQIGDDVTPPTTQRASPVILPGI